MRVLYLVGKRRGKKKPPGRHLSGQHGGGAHFHILRHEISACERLLGGGVLKGGRGKDVPSASAGGLARRHDGGVGREAGGVD